MDNKELEYYKEKLLSEKRKLNDIIDELKDNENNAMKNQISGELSFYDNHPGDSADELIEIQQQSAIKRNEMLLLHKINDALDLIETGDYGICQSCKKTISKERLDFLPYTKFCVACQEDIAKKEAIESRTVRKEEDYTLLSNPFNFGWNDNKDIAAFDAEDSYQSVGTFNRLDGVEEYYDEEDRYVDPIEQISNEQYRNQLPD